VHRAARRGAALLTVIVALAVLTALAVNVAYEVRVSVESAASARDELRAEYQARSGIALGRLVLSFQQQVDQAMGQATQQLGAAGVTLPRIQLWRLVPVSSTTVGFLFADEGAAPDGAFEAKLEDEDRKVNAQMDGSATTGLQAAQLASWFQLVADPRWDFLFDREDANGVKVTRQDAVLHLVDWVDENQTASALNGLVLESGFGDENYLYDRGPDRYRAKNARFDSLAELYLVAGFSDTMMAAFGDHLTVYLSRNAKLNVNTLDKLELLRNAGIMADPPGQPILSDPALPERLQKAVSEVTLGGVVAISTLQFAQVLQGLGISPSVVYLKPNVDQRGAFTDRPKVFRIRGKGSAGRVVKTIDAVVTTDPDQLHGQAAPLGRLLHWGEE
jgi:general secretion pathway protein K